jgi:hypothetical protein
MRTLGLGAIALVLGCQGVAEPVREWEGRLDEAGRGVVPARGPVVCLVSPVPEGPYRELQEGPVEIGDAVPCDSLRPAGEVLQCVRPLRAYYFTTGDSVRVQGPSLWYYRVRAVGDRSGRG